MTQVPLPPRNAKRLTTVCQFCIVGCGYRVYRWPEGKDGGPAPGDNALGVDYRHQLDVFEEWIAPLMHSVVTDRDGSRHNVAIVPDTEPDLGKWLDINTEYSAKWPNINRKGEPPADADEWRDKPGKLEHFSPNPGQGN